MENNNKNGKNNELDALYMLIAIIAVAPGVIKNLKEIMDGIGSFPNFPMKVANKHVMWFTLKEKDGYEIQQNSLTKHCRIIDPNNKRLAWGTYDAMIKASEYLQKHNVELHVDKL